MSLIYKEVPTGAVNGVNLVYTTAFNITQIVNIWIDGQIYLGTFTAGGTTITLSAGAAPAFDIFVDYYDSPPPTPSPVVCTGKISLTQARQALENRLKDISDVTQPVFMEWCDYINKFVYRYLLGVDPDRFTKEVSFNLIAGTTAYALDADFRDMNHWNTGFFLTDGNGNTIDSRLPMSSPGAAAQGYYISRGNFVFTPPVQPQNILYTKRYTVVQTPFTSMNDIFTVDTTCAGLTIIPSEYLQFLVNALAVQYQIWDEEISAESFADARFVRTLNELCETIRRQPTVYGLSDFSNTF